MPDRNARPTLLITGGSGMVGRNLQAHPASGNWRILAPSSSELDLRDGAALREYMARHAPDAVIHAAGVVGGIHANMAEPFRFLAANAEIGLNVIAAARENGIGTLINLASSCIYPAALGQGLSEDKVLSGPLEPTNEGYALAKIMTMRLCEYAMRENTGLHYRTLVPCNIYGLWDKFDPKHSHLLPAIIHKLHDARIRQVEEVEIWGDGQARREFMFAADLADAIFKALADAENLPDVMNIGPGEDHSVNDYYRIVADIIGWSGKFVHDLSRPVGMKRKLLDVTRQRQWGWAPPTSLVDGIRATYRFYLEEQAR